MVGGVGWGGRDNTWEALLPRLCGERPVPFGLT